MRRCLARLLVTPVLLLAACGGEQPGGTAGGDDGGGGGGGEQIARVATTGRDQSVVAALGAERAERVEITADLPVVLHVSTDGDDGHDGATAATALRTIDEAWRRIPSGTALEQGVRIQIAAGRYDASDLPNYWERRYGTADAPIVLAGEPGDRGAVELSGGLNVFDTSHLTVMDLTVRPEPAGDAFHCELCDHLVLRNLVLDGGSRDEGAQETLKVNQSTNVFVEDSDIGGATDNAIDLVAVQGGHLLGNTVHDAQDWCAYAKGGSAYLWVEGNVFSRCGTGGFTAGQGTGFEFMTAPWLTYEAMGVVVYRNVVSDTEGAGLGVNGGYNVLLAHNTLVRVGTRSHAIEVVAGMRSCDGDRAGCQERLDAGGWGATDEGGQWIPGRHVWILNNLVVNPSGHTSPYGQVAVSGAVDAPADSNVPSGTAADAELHIAGNVFDNGRDLPWVDGNGCRSGSCTLDAVAASNLATAVRLADPERGDYTPEEVAGWSPATIEAFDWSDAPLGAPAWDVTPPEAGMRPGAV